MIPPTEPTYFGVVDSKKLVVPAELYFLQNAWIVHYVVADLIAPDLDIIGIFQLGGVTYYWWDDQSWASFGFAIDRMNKLVEVNPGLKFNAPLFQAHHREVIIYKVDYI